MKVLREPTPLKTGLRRGDADGEQTFAPPKDAERGNLSRSSRLEAHRMLIEMSRKEPSQSCRRRQSGRRRKGEVPKVSEAT